MLRACTHTHVHESLLHFPSLENPVPCQQHSFASSPGTAAALLPLRTETGQQHKAAPPALATLHASYQNASVPCGAASLSFLPAIAHRRQLL